MLSTYHRLHLTIHATKREVIRAARKKINPSIKRDRRARAARHNFYREMLAYHTEAAELAKEFAL